MPGLLDFFGASDPQTQGLLAAAAQMLQASGPSLKPVSFGQVMGGGIGAFQQAQQQAQQHQLDGILRGLQVQEAQGTLADHQRQRQHQSAIDEAAHTSMRTPEQQAASLPGGPTNANAARIPEMQGGFDTEGFLNRVMAIDPLQGLQLAQQLKKAGPEYDAGITWVNGPDGKPMGVRTAKDGSFKALSGLAPRDKLELANLGGKDVAYNPFGLQPGQEFQRTMTPGELASNGIARQRLTFDKDQADAGGLGPLTDDAVLNAAQRYNIDGALPPMGMGKAAAAGRSKILNKAAELAVSSGLTGADLAAKAAEYQGTKAGQRTAGNRIANVEMASNEAQSLIPLARQASAAVSRSGFLPFGKAQIMFNDQTNDPALRQFAAANNALVNVYSRAISPSGTPTVADKEHAREMISTAIDQRSYSAVLDQMEAEIKAARAAPKAVRDAFNAEVTGRDHQGATAAPPAPSQQKFDMLPPAAQFDGKRMRADNGTTYVSRGGKWIKE